MSWGTFNIDGAMYDSKSFSFSVQDSDPRGIFFKQDGTGLYMVGNGSNRIYQYSISTPWDVSTISYENKYISVATQDVTPNSVFFNPAGDVMFVFGINSSRIYQYGLSTAWDVSTATYSSKLTTNKMSDLDNSPLGLRIRNDGTMFWMTGDQYNSSFQYNLSTAWTINTDSYGSKLGTWSTQDGSPTNIFFNDTGRKLFVLGGTNHSVYQYTLSTAYDVSTASYDNNSYDFSGQDMISRDIYFKDDGSKLYILGGSNKSIYQYTTYTPSVGADLLSFFFSN